MWLWLLFMNSILITKHGQVHKWKRVSHFGYVIDSERTQPALTNGPSSTHEACHLSVDKINLCHFILFFGKRRTLNYHISIPQFDLFTVYWFTYTFVILLLISADCSLFQTENWLLLLSSFRLILSDLFYFQLNYCWLSLKALLNFH